MDPKPRPTQTPTSAGCLILTGVITIMLTISCGMLTFAAVSWLTRH